MSEEHDFGIHVYDKCKRPFTWKPIEDHIMPLLPPGSCKGSLRALMPQDTIKIGPNDYLTICYNCELEVGVDVLLITMAGVMTPLPRIAVHPAPQDDDNA